MIFFCDSLERNSYCDAASDNCTGVMSAEDSLLSLKAKIKEPAFELPLNLRATLASISLCACSDGVPLLKLINILGARPFIILLI